MLPEPPPHGPPPQNHLLDPCTHLSRPGLPSDTASPDTNLPPPTTTFLPQRSRLFLEQPPKSRPGFAGTRGAPTCIEQRHTLPFLSSCPRSSLEECPLEVPCCPTADAPAGLHEALHQCHFALQLRQPGLLVQWAPGLGLGQALVGLSQCPVGLVVVLVLVDLYLQEEASGPMGPPSTRGPWKWGVGTWAQAS